MFESIMRIGKEFGEFLKAVQSSPIHLLSFPVWDFSPINKKKARWT